MQEYRSLLEDVRIRAALAARKSLLPVTAGALPAALLFAALLSVASRGSVGFFPAAATAVPVIWSLGFWLFRRQQDRWLLAQSGQPCRYDGRYLTFERPDEETQPLEGSTAPSSFTIADWAKRLNQGTLDPSELPPPGYVNASERRKAARVPAIMILLRGYNALRDAYLSGELAADGTPVWDLRTRLIKDIEEAAWKQGTVTDPGWHTRPRL